MKVYICKFLNKEAVGHKVRRIVAKEKKWASNKLKIFCVDDQIHKSLQMDGINSEILRDFQRFIGAEDEPSWDKVFELSDELRSSVENNNHLKYSGINFLTMEYHIIKYVFAVKLSNLLKQMMEQNYEIIVLVLTAPYIDWLADINTKNIQTVKYGSTFIPPMITRLCFDLMVEGYSVLNYVINHFQKLFVRNRIASIQKKSQKQPSVLFLVSYIIYAKPAMAIVDTCSTNKLIPYVATDNMDLIPLLESHHTEYWIKPPLSISLISSILHTKKLLLLPFKLRKHINSFYECNHHLETGLDEFSAENLCKKTMLAELNKLCFMAITRIIFLEKLMKVISPDILCVMPQSDFLQQIGWALTKQKNYLPTLTCSAAWEIDDSSSFRRHIHADALAVMGEKIKDIYMESGIEPERIAVTGAAHFDQLFNRNKKHDARVLSECGINPNNKIIIFATQPSSIPEIEDMLFGIISAIRKIKDFQLVVKTHPDENAMPYKVIIERYMDSRIHFVTDIDLYALINHCELLITKYSTTALEAMMIGKPVLTINLTGQPDPVPYAEEGVALGVFQRDDIEPAILKALFDEDTRNQLKTAREVFIRKWAGEPDGNASYRIVNLMKKIINKPEKPTIKQT